MFLIVTHGSRLNVRNCLGVVLMYPRSFVSHKRSTSVNKRSSKTYFGFAANVSIQTEENTHHEWFSISWWIVSVSQGWRLQLRLRKRNSSIHYPETPVHFLNVDDDGLQRASKTPKFSISANKAKLRRGGQKELWHWPSALLAAVSRPLPLHDSL